MQNRALKSKNEYLCTLALGEIINPMKKFNLKFRKHLLVSIETDVNLACWVDVVGDQSRFGGCHIELKQVACNKLARVTSDLGSKPASATGCSATFDSKNSFQHLRVMICAPATGCSAALRHAIAPTSPICFSVYTDAIVYNLLVIALQRHTFAESHLNREVFVLNCMFK